MLPTGFAASSSNATAYDGVAGPDHEECDEGCDSPDGSGVRLDSTSGSSPSHVTFSFGTPTLTPLTGAATQEFRLVLKTYASGVVNDTFVSVFDGASQKTTYYIRGEDISTTAREYVFTWDASVLDTADGSGVAMKINQSSYTSTDSNSPTTEIVIDAVEFNSYGVGAGGEAYDTGVVGAFDTFSSQQLGDASIENGFTGVHWLHGGPLTSEISDVNYMLLEMWDRNIAERTKNEGSVVGDHDNTWLPIEVGMLRAGPVYVPSRGMAYGWSMGIKDYGTSQRSRLGGLISRSTFKKRAIAASLKYIDHDESMQNLLLWLGLYAGKQVPVAVYPQPQRSGVQTLQNGFYVLQGDIDISSELPNETSAKLQLEEL